MNVIEVRELMSRLKDGARQPKVALQCSCDNLETVYVMLSEQGDVCVTDDQRTFQYLDRGPDSTYVPVESLDMASVRRICEELQVELIPAPPDGFPSIECALDGAQSLAEMVKRVSQAIDRVFEFAMRKI